MRKGRDVRLFPNAECGLLFTPFLSLEDEETETDQGDYSCLGGPSTGWGLANQHKVCCLLGQVFYQIKGLDKQSFKESWHYINEDILCLKTENITAEIHVLHDLLPPTHLPPSFPVWLLLLVSGCPSRFCI